MATAAVATKPCKAHRDSITVAGSPATKIAFSVFCLWFRRRLQERLQDRPLPWGLKVARQQSPTFVRLVPFNSKCVEWVLFNKSLLLLWLPVWLLTK